MYYVKRTLSNSSTNICDICFYDLLSFPNSWMFFHKMDNYGKFDFHYGDLLYEFSYLPCTSKLYGNKGIDFLQLHSAGILEQEPEFRVYTTSYLNKQTMVSFFYDTKICDFLNLHLICKLFHILHKLWLRLKK